MTVRLSKAYEECLGLNEKGLYCPMGCPCTKADPLDTSTWGECLHYGNTFCNQCMDDFLADRNRRLVDLSDFYKDL